MKVVVVGNCTLDLFFRVPRFPEAGETLLASARDVDVGGKGANQAVVAGRCGVAVAFLAALGNDADGATIRSRLAREPIGLSHVLAASRPTDQSVVYVTPAGENCVVSSHGAAASVTPAATEPVLGQLEKHDILLMQGNLSLEVTRHCLAEAKRRQARTVLNPAPIQYPYDALWPLVDHAILNQVEIRALGADPSPLAGGRRLLAAGVGSVVVTLGAQGATLISRDAAVRVAAARVAAVDTTGAGDVFCGVFAAALARGSNARDAVRRAVRAAGLAVTRPGAQASFPSARELRDILAWQP